jgi:hypothetical protein
MFNLWIYDNNNQTIVNLGGLQTPQTFSRPNFEGNVTKNTVVVTGVTVGEYIDFTIKFQIEEGSVATDYEAYGVQPSPDYPSEIRSVKSKSDNLFPPISTQTLNGITCTQNSDGSLTLNGTASSAASFFITKNMANTDIKVGQQYTLSTNQVITGVGYWLQSSDSSATWIANQIEMYKGEKSATAIISEQTATHYKFVVKVEAGTVLNNVTVKPMLNKGDKALPYAPYGAYVPVEVKAEGKNKFKLPETKSLNGINYTKNANGTFNMIGTATAEATFYADSIDNKFQSNTKYVCSAFGNIGGVAWRIDGYNDNKYVKTIWASNYTNNYFNTDMAGINKIICAIAVSSGTTININNVGLQIEEGSTATTYQPYGDETISLPLGDIELCSTPDGTRDTFERVDGVWNKVGKVISDIFDGGSREDSAYFASTNYRTADGGYVYAIYAMRVKAIDFGPSDYKKSYCSHFTNSYRVWDINENAKIGNYCDHHKDRSKYFVTNFATLKEFKEWLNNNPIQIVYILDAPTYTPITDPALI